MRVEIIDALIGQDGHIEFTEENEIKFNALDAKLSAEGLRIAAVSNTGLPRGKVRITYLPLSAFDDKLKEGK